MLERREMPESSRRPGKHLSFRAAEKKAGNHPEKENPKAVGWDNPRTKGKPQGLRCSMA
jgi:hypothetical protein